MSQTALNRSKTRVYRTLERSSLFKAAVQARKNDHCNLVRERLATRNERALLATLRNGRDFCWLENPEDTEPLVTVAIPTYNRPDTVVRAINSVIHQTYRNLEILVIGDATDSQSVELIRAIDDPRVRFVNLSRQGVYPTTAGIRGMVAGTKPMNVALDLASGAWIANCDDDDELLPHHVTTLLAAAKQNHIEFIYSKSEVVDYTRDLSGHEPVEIIGSEPLQIRSITRGSVLYSAALTFMRYDVESWRVGEPADWNLWKRMRMAGVRIGFLDEITYRYNWGESPHQR